VSKNELMTEIAIGITIIVFLGGTIFLTAKAIDQRRKTEEAMQEAEEALTQLEKSVKELVEDRRFPFTGATFTAPVSGYYTFNNASEAILLKEGEAYEQK